MKSVFSILLSIFCASFSNAKQSPDLELNDNIIFWSYAQESQKLDLIKKLADQDSAMHQFHIDDNYGSGVGPELKKMSACMDRRWYPAYMEFNGDLEIIHVVLACAYERHWFKDPYDDDYGVEIEPVK